MISCSCGRLAAAAIALCLSACAANLRPYAASHEYPPKLQLLEDDVHRTGGFISETAPAGLYVASQENDDYVFYRGSAGITERAYFNKPVAAKGGIAVSKRDPTKAIIFTVAPGGGANLSGKVLSRFVLKP